MLYLLTGLEEYQDFDEHGKEKDEVEMDEDEDEDEDDFEYSLDGVAVTIFLTEQILK